MVKKASTNELELIQAAKLGDLSAKDTLLRNLWDFMKKTHEYGPDGSKSQAKPCLRSTFEEALADMDLPELFEKCVQTYDPARGTFRNHLAFRMRMAAKDRVRDKTKIMQGKKEPKDALDSIFLSEREFQGYGHTEESADLEEDVRMVARESAIQQLVTLLVDNAIKYCDPGGSVRVALSAPRKGRQVQIEVSNSYAAGETIDYSRFFERFYRNDEAHSNQGGYGIGLSVAESICDRYRGSIKASWKDGDITFTCLLRSM